MCVGGREGGTWGEEEDLGEGGGGRTWEEEGVGLLTSCVHLFVPWCSLFGRVRGGEVTFSGAF